MSQETSALTRNRAVRVWLSAVAALVFAMVMVGGATRLTESGLSITEWKPLTGAVPPLSDAAWQAEFEKYKLIPQYVQMNAGMTLAEFKAIFWWEWAHRFLGRFIGLAYLLPFLFFLWRGFIGSEWRLRLWGIFALGALQGAVGWWMVASGLVERINVAPLRLAFHLTLAAVIYAALIWAADRMGQGVSRPSSRVRHRPQADPHGMKPSSRGGEADEAIPGPRGKDRIASPSARNDGRGRAGAVTLLVLVIVQIYLGALVAGLRAGYVYNTWPLIDGAFVPDAARLWFETPWWKNLFENTLTVQFLHRTAAYLVLAVAAVHAFGLRRAAQGSAEARRAVMLVAAIVVQAGLGILTLVHVMPMSLALAHQAMAMVVLGLATIHVARAGRLGSYSNARQNPSRAAEAVP
jgi:cytochrome c oxidase assembly protein subunit 15